MLRCRTCGREFEGDPKPGGMVDRCPHCGVTPCYVDVTAKAKTKTKKLVWPKRGGA